jgi:phosphate transport system substrate-binding protein
MIRSKFQGIVVAAGYLTLILCVGISGLSCDSKDSKDVTAGSAGAGASSSGGSAQLTGAGATFPAPLYTQWFKDYHAAHPDVVIEYQGIGSGAGIKQFTAGTTDFGASDAAMTDDQMDAVKGGVQLLPMTAGEVVLTFNVDGVSDIKLSRAAYSGIFLGTVKKWNDPAIAASNPGMTLPDTDINVVHRADGSGTTYCFTNHLSAISPDWQKGPGKGTTVNWPAGVGGKGNDGVTALIKQTPGSIGYVEFGYAMNNKLPMATLENKAGKFVAPTPDAGATALANVEFPANLRAFAPDPAGDASYPIVTFTWLLAHPVYSDAAKGKALKDVIEYGLTDGQKIATQLGYIPLPDSVVAKVKAAADTIKVGS